MHLSNIINYFKDCFVADNRNLSFDNFFSSKVEENYLIEGKEDLLNNNFSLIPLKSDIAEKYKKILAIHENEKSLVYCALFIVGKDYDDNLKNKFCAPLVYYNANIVFRDDIYFFEIDKKNPNINFEFLRKISEKIIENNHIINDFNELFSLAKTEINFSARLLSIINKNLPELDTEHLLNFPTLFSEKQIKTILNADDNQSGFSVLPACGLGIVKKSTETLGIINELTKMAEGKYFSKPLASIFGKQKSYYYRAEAPGKIPSVLNSAQQKILESVSQFPFSLIIGPPGTGKSYTIANMAIEQMSKGKSVLICSKTDEAVDIIADKIENQLNIKNVVVRAGRKEYLKELKIKLQNILNNAVNDEEFASKTIQYNGITKQIKKKVASLENIFNDNIENEIKWGNFISEKSGSKNVFNNMRIKYKKWKNGSEKKLWNIIFNLQRYSELQNRKTVEFIELNYNKQLNRTLLKHRDKLQNFYKGISSRTGVKQEEFFEETDFSVILRTFPIWLVKMSDIYKVLPLNNELFDVAIIDEATQCDIASCLPIIQRANKIVFAGDPHQLRHVSFLSYTNQNALKQKYNIDINNDNFNFRQNSVLDLINNAITDSNQVMFLNEHFRSLPAIISYSNRHFYSNALKIMTFRPENFTEGLYFEKSKGKRNELGYNKIEAEQLIEKLKSIINDEIYLNQKNCKSIGILSPFKSQVSYISEIVYKEINLESIEKHRITINTAYGFQGDERDIMLISFCLDSNSNQVAFNYLNRNDVFNVSITRAKSEQYIFYSFDIEKIKQNSLLTNYFANVHVYDRDLFQNPEKDEFALGVKQELEKFDIKVTSGFCIAGLQIDLIIQKNSSIVGIDLIGYSGIYNEGFPIERYKILKRTGIPVFPLPFSNWYFDKENCLKEILNLMNS